MGRVFFALKRIFDIAVSLGLLCVLAVPMLITAVVIRCESPGRAIFRQVRLGRGLRPFTVLKFRTMRVETPPCLASSELCGAERARSVTRVGRLLRRTGLDELPQLLNVLCGDMSLVGPRPLIAREHEMHALRQMLGATEIRPGITGLAQVSGRDDSGNGARAYCDALYARYASSRMDMRILLSTVRTLISGEGSN
jgi:O-antigen biosynthesis protein WbqP